MKKQLGLSLLVGVLGCSWTTPSLAFNISFAPAAQTVKAGDSFTLDIVVSGLEVAAPEEIVSAYDLDVTYNAALFSATGVTFGASLGLSLQDSVLTAGLVDLAEVSLESDVFLAGLQGDSVTLATLSFLALGKGNGLFSFIFNEFNDLKGNNAGVLELTPGTAEVQVGAVPEPSTLLLFGSGLVGWLGYRRRQQRMA